jgi:hypothetical protein
MGMSGLLLSRLETVHITEHPCGIEQINLFHLVGGKADL